ncbi:MAG: hypothetical protein QW404_00030 [Candidatus Nanoarchaeia archaeon]
MNQSPVHRIFKEKTLIIAEGEIWEIKKKKLDENYFKWYTKIFGVQRTGHLRDLEEDYNEMCNKDDKLRLVAFVINNVIRKNRESNTKTITLEDLIKKPTFVCMGNMYKLSNTKTQSHEIKIKNKSYSVQEKITELEQFERLYQNLDARLRGCFNYEIKKIARQAKFYDPKENIGFEDTEKGFFLYTLVKPYALYERTNSKYYGFGEAKIGIQIRIVDNEIVWHDAVVMNKYIHPALPDDDEYQKICTGNFSFETIRQKYKGKAEQIRIALEEARRMIERGYFSRDGSWNTLQDPKYKQLELKNIMGWRVTNI